ncbi:hypothetical protein B296_00003442 [Ensete ventricosum]|uniref:Uncharacterized protein n=1 Tax=Ensete ventricosum TaxID=4639 RepID=A0A427AZU0_ENSVE|nr:hypothetical protein B296_00003442 [Ensete ventricosum]
MLTHKFKLKKLRPSSMAGGCIIVEATTNSNTEPLLPSKVSYTRSLYRAGNKLRSLWSCLRWMCIDQSDAKYIMVSWSLFLAGVFVLTASYFVVSYAPTHHAYDVVV